MRMNFLMDKSRLYRFGHAVLYQMEVSASARIKPQVLEVIIGN